MTAALSARSLLGAGRVRAVYIIEGGAKPSSARREPVGSPRALARAARGREPWGSARSWRPEQRGAVFGWTRGRAGGQRGERAAVLLESLREGTEKATASPAAAASCSGVREETALKAHGQWLPPAGRAGCQPSPAGTTERPIPDQLRPCHARGPHARQQPLFPRRRGARAGPPPIPPRHAHRGVCLHIRDPRGAGPPRPIGRPAPRPGDVTGGGTGAVLRPRPGDCGLRGGGGGAAPGGGRRSPCLGCPGRRAEIAVPGSCGRDSPWRCAGCDGFSSVICVESATHTPEQQRLLLAYSSVSFVSEFSKVVILQVPALS
uniref:protein yippee-like 1 isoform X2 n=1 Tax=Agelaius phoeniceus TaxID=39638 RepID=UPI0023ECF147|nr:protein yippee-like 1 isoform X2 [Agelaius phoeniceus]